MSTQQLLGDEIVAGVVDYKGRTVYRRDYGGWRSAWLIIGIEIAERTAYYGISSNLITYLTGPLHQSTAAAAENVNIWSGASSLLPLLGAFVADSYLGRFRTILCASLVYILGLALLTLSTVLPSRNSSDCLKTENGISCTSPSTFRVIFFFFSVYLVAIAQAGHRPCVQAFGADQFDGKHPEEQKSKSSFFNWWYFGISIGTAITVSVLNYVQDYINWGLGFGIPCVCMAMGSLVFLLGTKTYRFSFHRDKTSPFARITQVFVAAARNWRTTSSSADMLEEAKQTSANVGSHQFRFLNRSLNSVSVSQVEEAKAVLRLIPIWATCLMYAIVYAQPSTFFTKQGNTMDRSIGTLQISSASLSSFISISVIFFLPVYDKFLVPIARTVTGKPAGITMLQRIGVGLFISAVAMVVAAVVETKRLQVALDSGLVDIPSATVPMSVWWLVPQYVLYGIAEVFTMIGLQEFFYDQVPNGLRSLGVALYLSIIGVGSLLSGVLVSAIEKATGGSGRDSWFSDNLNRAHLDYFYWLIAGLSAVELAAYLYFTRSYLYNRGNAM